MNKRIIMIQKKDSHAAYFNSPLIKKIFLTTCPISSNPEHHIQVPTPRPKGTPLTPPVQRKRNHDRIKTGIKTIESGNFFSPRTTSSNLTPHVNYSALRSNMQNSLRNMRTSILRCFKKRMTMQQRSICI